MTQASGTPLDALGRGPFFLDGGPWLRLWGEVFFLGMKAFGTLDSSCALSPWA